MSTRMVILGILRDRPLHGYELKRILEQRMGDWASIAFGSIYFALGKLAGEGMIRKLEESREGNRPSRSIYGITEAGRKEFLRLLRGCWQEAERQQFSIDMGVAFMDALPPKEVCHHLGKRIRVLEDAQEHLQEHEAEQMDGQHVPQWARFIFSHTRLHTEAELAWTKSLLLWMEKRGR